MHDSANSVPPDPNLCDWQYHGDDQWVFGLKVRGFVRDVIGEIYFDEDRDDLRGGWVWMTHGLLSNRGVAPTIYDAVRQVEESLGVQQ